MPMPMHTPPTTGRRPGLAAMLLALALTACAEGAPGTGLAPTPTPPPTPPVGALSAYGTDSTLDAGTWNLTWFGDPGNGPTDDALQVTRAQAVLQAAAVDLWAVQEVVSVARFQQLVGGVPGYAGVLANDARVTDGARYYSDFGDAEQKVGLVYRTAAATLVGARVILGGSDFDFAGRPPVEYTLRLTRGDAPLVVVVLHAKAGADAASYDRRDRAAAALKAFVDSAHATTPVLVLGDLNDDLDTSILAGRPSPYARFTGDAARWSAPTLALSLAGRTSTTGFADVIDHHLARGDAGARYVAGSAEVYRPDQAIADYARTVSDHYPVVARYRW